MDGQIKNFKGGVYVMIKLIYEEYDQESKEDVISLLKNNDMIYDITFTDRWDDTNWDPEPSDKPYGKIRRRGNKWQYLGYSKYSDTSMVPSTRIEKSTMKEILDELSKFPRRPNHQIRVFLPTEYKESTKETKENRRIRTNYFSDTFKLIKENESEHGNLADYLENNLDSWYGRLDELADAISDLGLDPEEVNSEYIIVTDWSDDEPVSCKITLGGTSRTISLEKFEMI